MLFTTTDMKEERKRGGDRDEGKEEEGGVRDEGREGVLETKEERGCWRRRKKGRGGCQR